MSVPWLCLSPACHAQSPHWAPLPSALRFRSCLECSGTCLRRGPWAPRASSPDSETLSRTSLGLNLAPGMAMMPTVTIRRKIRGDVGRAVTLPGTRGQCPSGSSHSVLHVHIYYRPCFRADATQAQRGHCCPRPHSLGVAEQGLGRWPCPLPHALDPRAPGQQSLYPSTSGQHQCQ